MTDRIPYKDDVLPPRGWVLARDSEGDHFWVDPRTITITESARTELTDEQIERVKRFCEVLGEAHPFSLAEALEGFEKDDDPEREIQVWETLTAVFQDEIRERELTDLEQQKLLLKVLLTCSWSPSIDDILASLPEAKALPNLVGVVQRFVSELEDLQGERRIKT